MLGAIHTMGGGGFAKSGRGRGLKANADVRKILRKCQIWREFIEKMFNNRDDNLEITTNYSVNNIFDGLRPALPRVGRVKCYNNE